MKMLVAQSVIFECFWCAQTTHVVCAHVGAQSFFLRRGAHACVARALRQSCIADKRERLAIPTRSQPQMRGLPQVAKKFKIDFFLKHVFFLNASTPFMPTPNSDTKTSPLQLISRLTVRSTPNNCWSEAEDSVIDVNDIYPLSRLAFALNCTPQGTLIRIPASRPSAASSLLHRPFHDSRCCSRPACLTTFRPCTQPGQSTKLLLKNIDRILESVNYEFGTYTLADWVSLFEVRFSLRVQQHGSALARPLVFWQAGSCASSMNMSGTARSSWTPRQVASELCMVSSHA